MQLSNTAQTQNGGKVTVDPEGCARKVLDIHGEVGAAWLERLPALVAAAADRWLLTILPPFPKLSYNYVAPVTGPGGEAWVLKAGVPHRELWDEAAALEVFAGRGIARLIAADRDAGLLLLERVQPGDSLKTVANDDAQVWAVAGVIRRLPRPLPPHHSFRTLAHLARGLDRLRAEFGGGYGPFPPRQVERGAGLLRELITGTAADQLIHGDMNPGNVLLATREPWLAIDPKGYAAHPLFDVATFLNDPPVGLAPDALRRLQERRIALFAEALNESRAAVLAWAEAHAVLSGWWSYEDHGRGWEAAFRLAELYASMTGHR